MSEFTAEEYRTAAKVARDHDQHSSLPKIWEDRAARLEAESARDEEAERLARVYWEQYTAGDTERDRYRFDRLCDDTQRVVKAGIRAVLEKVQMDAEWLIAEAVWETRIAYGEWPTEPIESAREGEVEKLAEDLAFAYCIGFGHDADEFKWNTGGRGHDAWLAVARQVLVLAADGRLLPKGGTVLDEFELDGIRQLVDAAAGFKDLEMYLASVKGMLDGIEDARRLRTTPPAVSVPLELPTEPGSRIKASVKRWPAALEWADADPYVDTFTLGDEDWWRAENDQLVVGAWNREYITVIEVLPAVSVPDCGPDGTPEKPWPTWDAAPDGVRYQSHGRSFEFVNRDGVRLSVINGRVSRACILRHESVNSIAPFVRVDGDKA